MHSDTASHLAELLWHCGTFCRHGGVSVAIDRHSTTEPHRRVIVLLMVPDRGAVERLVGKKTE